MSEINFDYLNSKTKRTLDVIGASTLACVLAPGTAALAPAVALDTKTAHPLYRQRRVGKAGKNFDVLKWRTIPTDRQNEDLPPMGAYDQRASRFGLFLRELGIDEQPQLANVLKGDMSLVGPRPLLNIDLMRLNDIDATLFNEWYELYTNTKPGLMGPSQFLRHTQRVSEDNMWKRSMELDLEYGEQASLGKDLKIMSSAPAKMILARLSLEDNSDLSSTIQERMEDLPALHEA